MSKRLVQEGSRPKRINVILNYFLLDLVYYILEVLQLEAPIYICSCKNLLNST